MGRNAKIVPLFFRTNNLTDQGIYMKTYIVLYLRGGRVASVINTPENLAHLKSQFCLSLIQKDVTGTLHYDVLGCYKKH
jgi:hypothetical protein